MLEEALEHLVRGLVDYPDDVRVTSRSVRRGQVLQVRVHPDDLGKVIGRVVCTIKDQALESRKLLLVRRLPNGPAVVAIDSVGAGAGETVYVCRGREAAFAFKPDEVPTEASVVAIVDQINRPEEPTL